MQFAVSDFVAWVKPYGLSVSWGPALLAVFLSGTGVPCELSGQRGAGQQPPHLRIVLGVAVGGGMALLHWDLWGGLWRGWGKEYNVPWEIPSPLLRENHFSESQLSKNFPIFCSAAFSFLLLPLIFDTAKEMCGKCLLRLCGLPCC